jgi:hypothetical protein
MRVHASIAIGDASADQSEILKQAVTGHSIAVKER